MQPTFLLDEGGPRAAPASGAWPVTWVVFGNDGRVGQLPDDAEHRLLQRCQTLLSLYFPPPRAVRAERYRARPVDQPGTLYLRLDFEEPLCTETGNAERGAAEFWPCWGAQNEVEVF